MIVLSNMVTPRIEREAESRNYGKYTISPLERGYGRTLGNAIRRVLLSSLEGAAITSIRITDVQHEYSQIKGIREDVIRAERVKVRAQDAQGEHFELEAEGLLSIAIQHENDHLDAKLIIDHLSLLRRKLVQRAMAKLDDK